MSNLIDSIKGGNPLSLTYYESEWGYCITLYSLYAAMKAANDKTWNKHAIISAEIGMVYNIAITPIFWGLLVPMVLPYIDWNNHE